MLCRAAANLMQRLCKSNAERQDCLIVMLRCRQSYANTLPTSAKRVLLSICRVQLSVMQKYIFPLTPPNFLDYFNADCAIGPTDKNSPTDELISHRSDEHRLFPCGGTRIFFEHEFHEICRRPTDQQEVISRIHNIQL